MKLIPPFSPLFSVLLLLPFLALGQNRVSIRGTVADSLEKTALPFANITLFNASDSLAGGVVTDEDGAFVLNQVEAGRYRIRITYVGYSRLERIVDLISDTDLGQILLRRSSRSLEEVEVVGKAAAARQRGDTTEFNAGSFKVNPDASTEDLVGKMPGVTIEGGQVKAQGQNVQQVLVDGKAFFGDDPSQALQNLPADMVEKIQVFDQLSEQGQFTGFDDGNRKKTINIVTKQNRRKGTFGKAYAGYGYEDKYAAGLALNRFDGDRRITVLSQANNINQQNFQSTDLLGVMNAQGMRGGGGAGRGGQGRRGGPGGGFGGPGGGFNVGQQSGITKTQAAGLNFTDAPTTWLDIRGSYFFNRADNLADQTTNRTYVSSGQGSDQKGLSYLENSLDRSINLNHRAFLRAEFKIDSNNILILRPRLQVQNNGLTSASFGRSSLEEALLSLTDNRYSSGQNALDLNSDAEYRHRFRKPGRTISLNINTAINNQRGLTDRSTRNDYFSQDSLTGDSVRETDLLLQDLTTRSRNRTLGSSLSYTEPLGKKAILQFTYRVNNQQRTSSRYTRDLEEGSRTIDSLSNALRSDYLAQEGGAGIRVNLEKLKLGGNLEYQRADLVNRQTYPFDAETRRKFNALLPQMELQYQISERRNLFWNLRSSTRVPSTSQLQAVVNNLSPLQLSTGNPNLKQEYVNAALFRYAATAVGTGASFTAAASGNLISDYIGNTTILSGRDTLAVDGLLLPPGTQLTRPENLGRRYEAFSFVSLGVPVTKLKSNLNLSTTYNFSTYPSLINGRRNLSDNHSITGQAGFSSNISESVDFTLNSSTSYSSVTNTLQRQLNFNYLNQATSLRLNLILWKSWVVGTNLTHNYYTGLSAGFNQNFLLWNGSIGKKFLKDNAAEIRLQVFDILGQNNSISRTVSDAYVEDVRTTVLQRYFMLTFSYTLRRFTGGGPGGGGERRMERREFGPGGHPGGGMPGGRGPY